MSQWCVESYPSSLYKFEIFSKLMFLAFCPQFWPGPGGAKSMPSHTAHRTELLLRLRLRLRPDYSY